MQVFVFLKFSIVLYKLGIRQVASNGFDYRLSATNEHTIQRTEYFYLFRSVI